MGDEQFEWKVAGPYDKPSIIAVAKPYEEADWWFGYTRHHSAGAIGDAIGDTFRATDRTWARQQYTNGALYMAFTPDMQGPFWVDAAIDTAYYRPADGDLSASGGPPGGLGRPTQDTVDFPEGQGRVAVFEHGHIYWWADTGPRTLSPVKVDVRFDRLYCRVETDGPGSDSPYLILSVFGPDGPWTQMATFGDDVDAGGTHRKDMILYHGAPLGLYLASSLWERDEGSPEEAKKKAEDIVKAPTSLLSDAVALVPGVGPVLVAGVDYIEGLLVDPLAGLLSDALGLEDDKIGDQRAVLTSKALIVAATDEQLVNGPPPTLAELRYQGQGGDYSAYLVALKGRADIVPAAAAGNRMLPGQTLSPDGVLHSADGRFTLIYQSDGNLVLYRNADGHALWSSGTSRTAAGIVMMQDDGNLVVFDPWVRSQYATGSWSPGASLVVQDDGNLVIYSSTGVAVWASNTVQ